MELQSVFTRHFAGNKLIISIFLCKEGIVMMTHQIWGARRAEAFFRKTFRLECLPARAVLRIFADTGYELFLNGRLVASVDEWSNTRDYDVLVFLREGVNTVAVHGLNHGGHRAFALELAADGVSVLSSDASWKSADEERWGWMLPSYDDSGWLNAHELDMSCAGEPQWSTRPGDRPDKIIPVLDGSPFFTGAIPKAVPSPFYYAEKPCFRPAAGVVEVAGEAYRRFTRSPLPETVEAVRVIECRGCAADNGEVRIDGTSRFTGPSFVLDFGRECVGYLRFRTSSDKPVSFRVFYGENLAQAMSEPSRDQLLHAMLYEECRLCPGIQEFESRHRVGFRFARVEFFDCGATADINGFHLRTSLYPVSFRGWFSCSDDRLNRIWRAGLTTLHWCMQEYYLDGVMRDRLLWVGDTRFEALFNYCLFADTTLFEFCWDRIAGCAFPDGGIPSAYGTGMSMLWDYIAWFVIAFHDYYLYTGKTVFLLKHRRVIARAVDYLVSRAGADGLIDVPKNPLDTWMVVLNEQTGRDTLMNSLYLRSLDTAAEIFHALGDAPAEKRYRGLAEGIRTKVAALMRSSPLEAVKQNRTSPMMVTEILLGAFRRGDSGGAIEQIRRTWGAMLEKGADTLYEGFQSAYPDIGTYGEGLPAAYGSGCHGWTAGATLLLMTEVAGIRPVAPGFRRFQIAPKPGDLAEIRAVMPTPHGEIALHLTSGGNARCRLYIPAGTTAEFEYRGVKREFSDGLHDFFIDK